MLMRVAARAADECALLAVGASMLLPGGWRSTSGGHAIMFFIERQAHDSYLFAVINTGSGAEYHPRTKLKQPLESEQARTAIALKNIPLSRISDRGIWFMMHGMSFSSSTPSTKNDLY